MHASIYTYTIGICLLLLHNKPSPSQYYDRWEMNPSPPETSMTLHKTQLHLFTFHFCGNSSIQSKGYPSFCLPGRQNPIPKVKSLLYFILGEDRVHFQWTLLFSVRNKMEKRNINESIEPLCGWGQATVHDVNHSHRVQHKWDQLYTFKRQQHWEKKYPKEL